MSRLYHHASSSNNHHSHSFSFRKMGKRESPCDVQFSFPRTFLDIQVHLSQQQEMYPLILLLFFFFMINDITITGQPTRSPSSLHQNFSSHLILIIQKNSIIPKYTVLTVPRGLDSLSHLKAFFSEMELPEIFLNSSSAASNSSCI